MILDGTYLTIVSPITILSNDFSVRKGLRCAFTRRGLDSKDSGYGVDFAATMEMLSLRVSAYITGPRQQFFGEFVRQAAQELQAFVQGHLGLHHALAFRV